MQEAGLAGSVAVSPASLSFPNQNVGTTSAPLSLTVSNTGSSPLQVTVSSISGPFTNLAPPFSLAAGENRALPITFSPTVEGSATGTLTLRTDDPSEPTFSVALTGKGVKPNLVVSPSPLAFGEQLVGTASTARKVTVTNAGTGSVTVTGLSLSTGAPFAVSPSSAFTLTAGLSLDLSVTFSPTAKGAVSATLTLSTDDAASPSLSIPLSGTGVTALELSPSALDFGEVAKGTTVKRTVTLTNSGATPIQIVSVSAVAPPFSVSGPVLPVTVAAKSSITFDVGFSPTSAEVFSAVINVQSDAANSPHSLTLSGTGVVPEARLSLADGTPIAAFDFGAVRVGSSKQGVVRLTNTGKASLTFSAPPVVSGSAAFAYVGPDSITLPPGTYFDFQVSFSPASSGAFTGTLTLRSNAVNSPTVLSLLGTGAAAELTLSPGSVFFGDLQVGSQVALPVTLKNTGNAAATVQSLSSEGPFAAVPQGGATLPLTLAPGASFVFDVIFKPAVQGAATGSVSVTSDASSSPLKVALSGTGTVAQLVLSTSALDFGSQRVRTASEARPLVLANNGTAELEITQFVVSNPAFSVTLPLPLPSESAPLKLGPGQQKAVALSFLPSSPGLVDGKLFIVSNSASAVEPLSLKGTGVDGRLSLTPAVVSFSGVEVGGAAAQKTVMLTNVGDAPLTLTDVTAPTDAAFSLSGLSVGKVLQPGEGQTFTVTFLPVRRGYVSTSAIIKSDAVTSASVNLALDGTGVAPAVEVLPKELVFGQVNVGSPVLQNLTIKNVGEKDLAVSNLAFEDAASGSGAALDFGVMGPVVFPLTVPPGSSTTVSVKFTPRQVGLRQARALVYTNDRTAEVYLQGEGTSPSLKLSASLLDFGRVLVGSPSAPRTLELTNLGTGPLTLTTMRLSGADVASFLLSGPTLPVTLVPGSSAEVVVTLRPDAERSFSAVLVVESNDASASSAAVPLSGTGVRQQIQLSASSLEFGRQLIHYTSLPRKLRVINSSDSNATLTALTVQGSGSSQFSLVAPPLPLVLAPGQEQDVAVSFTPVSESETSSTLKLSFGELPQPLEVALHGQGIPTVLAVNPSPLDFGSVRVGAARREQPLTVTNLSGDPIVLAAVEVTYSTGEPFTYDAASVQGRTLEPGMSLIVPVGYQPMVESLSETVLSFGTTSPARPRAAEVQLAGWATKRFLVVDPESLAFGRVDVTVPVEPKAVTVTNKSAQTQRVVVKLRDAEGTPFSVQTSALSEPLAAGATVTFKVAYQPQTAGDSQNEVQVWLQGATEPDAVIPVTGSARSITGEPEGCSCGTTDVGSSGLMALLVMVGLGSRRRRRA